jgi:hypothetical protein
MEFFTALLASLLTLGSPVGYVLDQVTADNFRSRLYRVEQLQVRIDNTPNYQVAQGHIDRLRLASRGAWVTPELRLDALELETDPIDLDLSRLSSSSSRDSSSTSGNNDNLAPFPPGLFRTPLQAGVRLVITEADLQQALQSPKVQSLIQEIARGFLGSEAETISINPQIKFLDKGRFQLQIDLQTPNNPVIKVDLVAGLTVVDGSQLRLESPVLKINGSPLPNAVVMAISNTLLDRFDLKNIPSRGIIFRLLQLHISPGQLEIAAFISAE